MTGGRRGTTRHGAAFNPIPRIVHQTWKSAHVPDEWKGYQETWRQLHPTWEYRLWTDDDNRRLIAAQHPWFLPTYDAFSRDIQRVDAAKYFILFTHGGVYADLDCECVRAIEPLVSGGGAVVSRTRDRVIDCAVMASPPGHALWPLVFDRLQHPRWFTRLLHRLPGLQASHVLFSTGTRMMKGAVSDYVQRNASGGTDGLTVLDASVLSSRSWLDRYQPFEDGDTFVRHHYTDSWLLPDERKVHAWFTRRVATAGAVLLAAALATVAMLLVR